MPKSPTFQSGVAKLSDTLAWAMMNYAHSKLDKSQAKNQFAEIVEQLVQALSDGNSHIKLTNQQLKLVELSQLATTPNELANKPLMIEGTKLFFQKQWNYEWELAKHIHTRAYEASDLNFNQELKTLFFEGTSSLPMQIVEQQLKVLNNSFEKKISLICGGPGTGKTSLLVKIVLAHLHLRPTDKIAIAAPTGKSVARIKQALMDSSQNNIARELKGETLLALQDIEQNAQTIHRLLKYRFNSTFAKNQYNQIEADLVIIDEVSMLNLAVAKKLLDAINKNTRLVLIGDFNQLSSIESGNVLKDIAKAIDEDCCSNLTHTFRFDSDVAKVAEMVNLQDLNKFKEFFAQEHKHIKWIRSLNVSSLEQIAKLRLTDYLQAVAKLEAQSLNNKPLVAHKAELINNCFLHLQNFIVLCSNKLGMWGTEKMNMYFQSFLTGKKDGKWQFGLPIILNSNQPQFNIFNGDIGFCGLDEHQKPTLIFLTGQQSEHQFLPMSLIDLCDPAFAITIHKSQGSEFKHVLLALTDDEENKILAKELLYTAITRCKESLVIYSKEEIVEKILKISNKRLTGLAEKIKSLAP